MKIYTFHNYELTECNMILDPMSHRSVEVEELGLIPTFINRGRVVENGFLHGLSESYGFPLREMTGGHITKEGKYVFRGDPDLYPLAKYATQKEVCYQYDYAIIAIVDKDSGETFVTRMD